MLETFGPNIHGGIPKYAWRVDDSGTEPVFYNTPTVDVYVDPVDLSLPTLEPAQSWTLRLYGLLLPMARFNNQRDYTPDYMNFVRICLDSHVDCIDFEQDNGVAEFVDPQTGYRYIAPWSNKPEQAPAARLLTETQAFVNGTYLPARNAYEAAPTDDTFAAWQSAEKALNERMALIEITRNVSGLVSRARR